MSGDLVFLLIDHGPTSVVIDHIDRYGEESLTVRNHRCVNVGSPTALMYSIIRERTDIVKYILCDTKYSTAIYRRLLNERLTTGQTALELAMILGLSEVVEYILDKESIVQDLLVQPFSTGYYPLHDAVRWGNRRVIKRMYELCSDVGHLPTPTGTMPVSISSHVCTDNVTTVCSGSDYLSTLIHVE